MTRPRPDIALAILVFSLCIATATHAQQSPPSDATYPNKPVHVILPEPPGGSLDTTVRPIMTRVAERMGKAFVLESKAGASGAIGVEYVAKAPADGYTLLAAALAHLVTVPLTNKVPYATQRDLEPIAEFAQQPYLLAVNAASPVTSVKDLIALARSKPGAFNYGSGGSGTTGNLFMELLKQTTGIDVAHVPYRGNGPLMVALRSGEVNMAFGGVIVVAPLATDGAIRVLAVTSAKRLSFMPEMPTIAEAALPGFEAVGWYGLLAPKGTPPAVIARLNREVNAALNSTGLREVYAKNGMELTSDITPGQFQDVINRETAKWTKLLKQ